MLAGKQPSFDQSLAQGHEQEKGHAHTGESGKGKTAVPLFGVEHGLRERQGFLGFVMVGDHHLEAALAGILDLLDRGDAAVHGNEHTALCRPGPGHQGIDGTP